MASWLVGNLLVDDILDNMILANIPIAALAFGLLGGLLWRGAGRSGAWAALVVAFVGAIAAYLWFGDAGMYTWWWAFAVVPASFVVGIIASKIWPDEVGTHDAFYEKVGQPWIG